MSTAAPTWAPGTRHDVLARTVAAHGLAGSTLSFTDEPLGEREFARLMSTVRSQRLSGLLWSAVSGGAFPATPSQVERVEWMHVEALAGALALERLLVEVVTALESADVPVRVLKGPALARLDYPTPEWRTFGDVDLMVRGDNFDRAVRLLSAWGHRRRHPQPRPGFDRRFSKGTSFVTSEGLELDLHRTFTMGPFGVRLSVESLWSDAEPFHLAGHTLAALPREARFVHACYHAVLGEVTPRLSPLRDIAQLALTGPLDVTRVHEIARASKGEVVVSRAVRQAWHALAVADVLAISAWAHSYRMDSREAADLAVYEDSSYAGKSVASIRALPTWRDRAAFVHAMALPSRSYLGERHAGHLDRLRTGLGQATAMRRT